MDMLCLLKFGNTGNSFGIFFLGLSIGIFQEVSCWRVLHIIIVVVPVVLAFYFLGDYIPNLLILTFILKMSYS